MNAADARPRVVWLLNGFQQGGAERGLLHLVRGGAFQGCDLHVAALFEGRGDLGAALRATGVEVTAFSRGPRMTPTSLASAALRLPAFLARVRPHVLILSLPQANLLGRLVSRIVRPRVVASFEHNTRLAKPVYERLWRLTSGWVDWLIADAPRTAVEVERRLYRRAPSRSLTLPLTVLQPAPPPLAAEDAFDGRVRLVNAARFTPVKNQAALVRAVALLRRDGLDASAALYGEGEGVDACRALATELGVGDHVAFPGFRERWWEAGEGSDVFALASRHEGLCIAALEAMNAGVPVVAPLIGGLCDYASDATMTVVPDVEPETLARAVRGVALDPVGRSQRAAAAQARVQALYGPEACRAALARFAADLHAAARGEGLA